MAFEEEGTLASEKRRQFTQEQQKKVSRYGVRNEKGEIVGEMDDEAVRNEIAARRARASTAGAKEMREILMDDIAVLAHRMKLMTDGKTGDELKAIEESDEYKAMKALQERNQARLNSISQDLPHKVRIEQLQTERQMLEADIQNGGMDQTELLNAQQRLSQIDAELESAQKDLEQAEIQNEEATKQVRLSYKTDVSAQVDAEFKLTDIEFAEAQEAHAELVERLKKESEAAADLWIYEESQKEGSKIADKKSQFVSEHIAYVRKNGDAVLSDGNGTTKTVKEMFAEMFGASSLSTGYYSASAVKKEAEYVSKYGVIYDSTDKDHPKRVFKCTDKNGHSHWYDEAYVDTTTGKLINPDSPFRFATDAAMFAQSPTAPEALTPDAAGGKFGNNAAKHIRSAEYGPKAQRAIQRQERKQERKNG